MATYAAISQMQAADRGEMEARIAAFDWAGTPLGPMDGWPSSLRTALSICLASRFPMVIWWGPQLILLYNDAWRPVLGATKHPRALGSPGREIWPEIWDVIGPMFDSVLATGEATWSEDGLLLVDRYGYTEEAYFTWSYSPIPDDLGGVCGVFTAFTDTTERVLGERRTRTLRDLAARSLEARQVDEACRIAAETLSANPHDLPFALLYLVEPGREQARLVGTAGLPPGTPASPTLADLRASPTGQHDWPLSEAARSCQPYVVEDVRSRFGELPGRAWPDAPRRALIAPVPLPGHASPELLLVAGISPRLALDEHYRGFLDLVAGHIVTAVAAARAYEEERRRAEALAELDRAKSIFFSNVSHEFRTPLTLMLGPIEDSLVDVDEPLPPRQRERQELVQRNGLRLLRLVNTLLDFSRIEAGRVQASYEPTDLPAYTAELASTFRAAVERAGLRLVLDCPPLPAATELYVDREMWENIVLNLLSNAFKHTFEGEIGVAVRSVDEGRAVCLAVRDTGTGIPVDELPRLFERFHRVEGARARTHEGTGIGVALVQELVKLHGGTISVESELGRGTTFKVVLPTGVSHLPSDRIRASRQLASTASGAAAFVQEALRWFPDDQMPPGLPAEDDKLAVLGLRDGPVVPAGDGAASRGRVLLADDNSDLRAYVTRLLAQWYEVEAVADGEAALAAARARPPDLVLGDVMMPRLDGFGLLRALREDPRTREIPVVLLSARAGEEATIEGIERGADDYLLKPFAARELLARVRTHLELARLRADTTARERVARAEAEAEHTRLYNLFMQAPAIVGLLRGPDHVCELANPRLLQFLGKKQDFLGRPVREGFPELAEQGYFELLDGVYRTGEPFVGQEMLVRLDRRGDGTLEDAYVNFIYQPYRGADGAVEGIVLFAVEVTDQVRARLAAEAAQAQSEAALKARDQFLSIASHELKTPVAALKGLVQLVQRRQIRGDQDTSRLLRSLEVMAETSDRLGRLVDELLDVSRIRTGFLALAPEPTDLVALVRRAVARAEELGHGDHSFVLHVPPGMLLQSVDPGRLDQVLTNLLENAVKYSPSGGPVQVTVTRADGGVLLQIEDCGIGLPPGTQDKIFEPFGRAQNATARHLPGLGLGLHISRNIVERHGGWIRAESAGEGLGTAVQVWLPLHTTDAHADPASA